MATIARATQVIAETLNAEDTGPVRATQVVLELLSGDPISARVTQVVLELLTPSAVPWVDIADFVEQEIVSSAYPGGAARVMVELWSAPNGSPPATMKARLYDVTHAVSVGQSANVSSTVPVEATFAVVFTPGTARYRLQVTANETEVDLFAIGAGVIP